MRFIIFWLLTFSLLLVTACDPAKPVSISETEIGRNRMPRTNMPMPPKKPIEQLGWKILDGKNERFSEYKGKVVILDFWATYCPPCIEEIPHLNELQTKYGEKGLQVIGLHVGGEEDEPKVPAFVDRLKIDYTLATPEDDLIYSLLGTDSSIPQTIVFDRNGKLVRKFVGYDEIVKNQLDELVEKTVNAG